VAQNPAQNPADGAVLSPPGFAPNPSSLRGPTGPIESQPGFPRNAVPQPAPEEAEPTLGLQGFCPVTLFRDRVWQEGDRAFGCFHRGRLYLFCTANHRDEFRRSPDDFAPVLSGYDPVIFAEEGRLVEGKREHGRFVDDRIILFAEEATFEKFRVNTMPYIQAVRQAMATSDNVRR